MALAMRFGEDLADPTRISRGHRRDGVPGDRDQLQTLGVGWARQESHHIVDDGPEVELDALDLELPASTLEKSRMSLMMASKASPELRTVWA